MPKALVFEPTPKVVSYYDTKKAELHAVLYVPGGKASHREEVDGFVVEWTSTPTSETTAKFEMKVTLPENADIPFLTSWSLDCIDPDGIWLPQFSYEGHPPQWPFEVTIPNLRIQKGIVTEYQLGIWDA